MATQATLPGVPVRFDQCGCFFETAGDALCLHCLSRALLVKAMEQLFWAQATLLRAYQLHPDAQAGHIKSRLSGLLQELRKLAGVE